MNRPLNKSASVTLDATGAGTARIGPSSSPGSPNWTLDALLWATTRPGTAPIPRIQVYIDQTDPSGLQVQSYDGSFGSASGSIYVPRGSNLIAVWTGGQSGDVASISLTGTAAS